MSIEEEEVKLKSWPRRLLHVPSMTSFPWTEGNFYGGIYQPLYNAISYTWGRFEIREDDVRYSTSPALNVHNTPWTIPKVDPAAFSVDEFQSVLQAITRIRAIDESEQVDFVWLDVACIDQRRDSLNKARSDAEIGRQAEIFGGAQSAFIWLRSIDSRELLSICETLESCYDNGRHDYILDSRPLNEPSIRSIQAMRKLMDDPWFSSLWTLQEAFLVPTACLLSREGKVVHDHWQFDLNQWDSEFEARSKTKYSLAEPDYERRKSAMVTNGAAGLNKVLSWARMFQQKQDLRALIRSAGLLELGSKNPMAAYTAASARYTSRVEDRVYAIQQIFRLRLGTTAVNLFSSIHPIAGQNYTLSELRDQLGEQLLLKQPVLSQMYLYTECAPPGQGWRAVETCISPGIYEVPLFMGEGVEYPVPPDVWGDGTGYYEPTRSICKLDVLNTQYGVWGTFEGKLCSFRSFLQRSKKLQTSILPRNNANIVESLLEIWRDATEELQGSPTYGNDSYHAIPTENQHEFADWLALNFAPSELQVLILGFEFRFVGGEKKPRDSLGLLMCRRLGPPLPYWRRIGIYRQRPARRLSRREIDDDTSAWLEGETSEWETVSGTFG